MLIQEDEYLAHFGVLGMKWGRRKAKSSSGGSSRKRSKAKKVKKSTLNDEISKMSNDELKAAIARKQLEQQYAAISAPKLSRTQTAIAGALAVVGATMLKDTAKTLSTKLQKDYVAPLVGVESKNK